MIRRILTTLIVLLFTFGAWAQFSSGDGTTGSPYLLSTEEDLRNLAIEVNGGNSYTDVCFQLTGNITLSDRSWTPIGNATTPFGGLFDGDGHVISNLWIESNNSNVGLFGQIDANSSIRKLGIIIAPKGIKGAAETGGLVGSNKGNISSCYVSGTGIVEGTSSNVGGLVGINEATGSIMACYTTIDVTGSGTLVGGLAGYNLGTIQSCYTSGTITGTFVGADYVGGLAGLNESGAKISDSFAVGSAVATVNDFYRGDLAGYNSGIVNNCKFLSDKGLGFLGGNITQYARVTLPSLYSTGGVTALNSDADWGAIVRGLPYLKAFSKPAPFPNGDGTSANPLLLYTEEDLRNLAIDINGGELYTGMHFQLMNDISLTSEWTPIGGNGSLNKFDGYFHGEGHAIKDLRINSTQNAVGFFGCLGENSSVDKLGVFTATVGVTGQNDVGALVGLCYGEITACYVAGSGSVKATANRAGALAGSMENAEVVNCYAVVDVFSTTGTQVGGLVGFSKTSSIRNSYAANSATGVSSVGGLVGHNGDSSVIRDSYYNSHNNQLAVGTSDLPIAPNDTVGVPRVDMAVSGLGIMPNLNENGGLWYPGNKVGDATYNYPSPILNTSVGISIYQLKLNTNVDVTYKEIMGILGEKIAIPANIGNPTRANCTFKDWLSENNKSYMPGDSITLYADSTFRARWTATLTLPADPSFTYEGGVTAGDHHVIADSLFRLDIIPAEFYRIDSIYVIDATNPNDTIHKTVYSGVVDIKVTKAVRVAVKSVVAQHTVTLPELQEGLSYVLPLKVGLNPAVDMEDFSIIIKPLDNRHRNLKVGTIDFAYNNADNLFSYVIEGIDASIIIPEITVNEYYIVKYNVSGGIAVNPDSVIVNNPIPGLLNKTTRAGCTLAYWVDKDNNKWDASKLLSQDTTLTAVWHARVTIASAGAGSSVVFEGAGTDSTLVADTEFVFSLVIEDGYRIGSVKIADVIQTPNEEGKYSLTVDKNITVTVTTIKWYTVTFGLNGAVGTTPSQQIVDKDALVSVPTPPVRRGYVFNGWFKNGSSTAWNFTQDKVIEDMTLLARWTLDANFSFDEERVSVPYNGQAQTAIPSYTISGLDNYSEENITFGYLDKNRVVLENAPVNAGLYYVTAVYEETGNNGLDVILRDTVQLEITHLVFPESIKLENATYTFDGNEKELKIQQTLPAGTTPTYTNNKRTDVGEQIVTVVLTNINYVTKTMTATLKIQAADIPGTVQFKDATLVYDGSTKGIWATGVPDGVEVTYTNNTGTNVGTYQAEALLQREGYNDVLLKATLVITPAKFSNSIRLEGGPFTYDGTQKEVKIVPENLLPEGTTVTYSNEKKTNAGTYKATAVLTKANYETKTLEIDWTINKANFPASITFNDASFVYDSNVKTVLISGSSLPAGTSVAYTGNTRTNIGISEASVVLTNSNYNTKTLNAKLEITPTDFPPVALTGRTFVYNGNEQKIEISGTLPANTTVVYTNNRAVNAGTYKATAVITKANYNTITLEADWVISKAEFLNTIAIKENSFIYDGAEKEVMIPENMLPAGTSVVYSNDTKRTNAGNYRVTAVITNPNYNTKTLVADWVIHRADFPESIVLQNAEYVYESGITRSMTISGGARPSGTGVSYRNNVQTNAGVYNVEATLINSNYNTKVLRATLTITPTNFPTSITFRNASFVYDANVKTIQVSGSLPDGTDVVYTNNTRTNAGVSEAKAELINSNYNTKTLEALLEVTLADFPTSITFNNRTFTYNGAEQKIEVSGALPAGTNLAYTNSTNTNVGTYQATVTLTNSNYRTRTLNATWAIVRADFSGIVFNNATFIYDGAEKTIIVSGQLPAGTNVAYTGNRRTEVGTSLAQATLTNPNYNTRTLNASLIILENQEIAATINEPPGLIPQGEYTYVVDQDKLPMTEAVFTVNMSSGATLSGVGVRGNTVTVPLNQIAENKTILLTITAQNGVTKRTIPLIVKKHFVFNSIVVQKWNNVLLVNNNPGTNGGYSFMDYTWYRGSREIGQEQVYSAGHWNNSVLSVTEPYRVVVTTVEGVQLETYPSMITLRSVVDIYPTIVSTNAPITVDGLDPERTNIASIYNTQGVKMSEQALTDETDQLVAPSIPGNYIIKVNEVTTSIVVK